MGHLTRTPARTPNLAGSCKNCSPHHRTLLPPGVSGVQEVVDTAVLADQRGGAGLWRGALPRVAPRTQEAARECQRRAAPPTRPAPLTTRPCHALTTPSQHPSLRTPQRILTALRPLPTQHRPLGQAWCVQPATGWPRRWRRRQVGSAACWEAGADDPPVPDETPEVAAWPRPPLSLPFPLSMAFSLCAIPYFVERRVELCVKPVLRMVLRL